jgi:hypothetical protein
MGSALTAVVTSLPSGRSPCNTWLFCFIEGEDVILYHQNLIGTQVPRILLLVGRVGDSHNLMAHCLGNLERQVPQATDTDHGDALGG